MSITETALTDSSRRSITDYLVFAVFLGLLTIVALLGYQNMQLKGVIAGEDPMDGAIRPGESVSLEKIAGIAPGASSSRATLLLTYSNTCPACMQTREFWNELADNLDTSRVRVVGIEVAPATGETEPLDLHPSIDIRQADESTRSWLDRVPAVPATVLVDHDGTVQQVWFGVPDEEARAAITAAVGA